jgi:hydrogenase maturation factor
MMLHGKLPPDALERLVFTRLGQKDPDLILGPGTGRDAALIRIGESIIVASTDPITGSIEDIGWLSVHVNANDIATFGVAPRWFFVSIMLPSGSGGAEVGRIMEQIDDAAKSLGITVAGGHTEVTGGIDRPIVAGFMLGVTSEGRYVTSSGAHPGDSIILTKTVGIEGTAIIAAEGAAVLARRVGERVLSDARSLRSQISVVGEGLAAFETGYVTAMHDPTEGGLAGGIHEICDASGVGFEIDLDAIPIHPSTQSICRELDINVLELISSGCMILTCDSGHSSDVIERIKMAGVEARVIGSIVQDRNQRDSISGQRRNTLARPSTDALWHALTMLKTGRSPSRSPAEHRSRSRS